MRHMRGNRQNRGEPCQLGPAVKMQTWMLLQPSAVGQSAWTKQHVPTQVVENSFWRRLAHLLDKL
jgi:hypothetical protein